MRMDNLEGADNIHITHVCSYWYHLLRSGAEVNIDVTLRLGQITILLLALQDPETKAFI